MSTAKERKDERTARIIAARAARERKETARERKETMDNIRETLGEALTESLLRYLAGKPAGEVTPIERAIAMVGYSDELKQLLVRCIELNPAMEGSFLNIAELAYADGKEAERDDHGWDYEFET